MQIKQLWISVNFLFCICIGTNLFSDTYTDDLNVTTEKIDKPESVYALDLKKDIVFSTVAAGVFLTGYVFMDDNDKIAYNLDKNDVNFIDRGLMFYNNDLFIDKARNAMTPFILGVTGIIPMTLGALWGEGNIGIWKEFDTWFTYGVMYMQAFCLTYGTRKIIGKSVDRFRPAHYFEDNYGQRVNSDSFPSGTTALAFMPATFLSVTFSAEYPDSPAKIPVIVGSYTLASIVGAIRIFTGNHFLTDVLAGAAIGSFYGWLIPTLHRKTDDRVSFMFTGNGGIVSIKI